MSIGCCALITGCSSSVPVDLFGSGATGSSVAGQDSVSVVLPGTSGGAGQPAAGSGGSGGSGGFGSGQSDLTTGGADAASSDAGEPALDDGGSSGSAGGESDLPCSPFVDGEHGMTGAFGTTGAVCYRVSAEINGWGCSNFEGRTLKVNNVSVSCAELPLPDKLDGNYYFDVSAGDYVYASLYWF